MELSDSAVDVHLDAVLRAAGSALRHYSLPKSKESMRSALRASLGAAEAEERQACAGIIHDAARAAADNNDLRGYSLLTALGDAILARGQA